jgi:Spy/CpxP family protein refolding chaperone
MTIQSRTLLTIAAAAVAVTATIAVAGATQAQAQVGRGLGMGPGRAGFAGPALILRRLNLTDSQREQIRALTEAERSARRQGSAEAPGRKLAELHRSLQAAIYADNPDMAQIEQLKANIAEAEAVALAARVDIEVKIAQILTPEQRAQARDLVAHRANRAGRAGRLHGAKPGASGQ